MTLNWMHALYQNWRKQLTTSQQSSQQNKPGSSSKNDLKPLSQEELKAWWPFERLDPKRFPKATKTNELDDVEEALL